LFKYFFPIRFFDGGTDPEKNKNSAVEVDKYWTSKQWEQFQLMSFKHSPACKKTVHPLR